MKIPEAIRLSLTGVKKYVDNINNNLQENINNIDNLKADKSELFSGDYNDLSNKPNIPSIEGLASESYVDNSIAGIVNSAPETLNTLNELAQALGDDPSFATTVSTEIGKKANSNDLAAVATSGSYNDLTNKPDIPSIEGLATEKFVTDKIAETHKNDSQYVTQEQLNTALGNITLKKVTQTEYDALTIKDPNTLYIIM